METSNDERATQGESPYTRRDDKFKSVRRVFRIMDLVGERGEDLTAKQIAHELGTNLSSCYYLLGILVDEGYIERVAQGVGTGWARRSHRCERVGPGATSTSESSPWSKSWPGALSVTPTRR